MLSLLGTLLLLAGCATPEIPNWDHRVGNYTYNQAVQDLGVPQHSTPQKDGSIMAEWITQRGTPGTIGVSQGNTSSTPAFWNSPLPDTFHATADQHLQLTFGSDHKLKSWVRFER